MNPLGSLITGIIAGLVGLIALVFAAKAHAGPMYVAGLIVFAATMLFVFFLIKRWFDTQEATH